MLMNIFLTAWLMCGCATGPIPIDFNKESFEITVTLPETGIDLSQPPPGVIVPFNEDAVLIEVSQERRNPDGTYSEDGKLFQATLENPLPLQKIKFDTEPQTWTVGVGYRWKAVVKDGWVDEDTGEFNLLEHTWTTTSEVYVYPWSGESKAYKRDSTVPGIVVKPVKE